MSRLHSRSMVWLLFGLAVSFSGAASGQSPTFTPQQLKEDLTALDAAIARIHPNLSHSVAQAEYSNAMATIRNQLDRAMTADEAWATLCRLNAVFDDSHLVVTYPGGAANEIKRHTQSGGKLFPFNVHVDAGGELYIRSRLDHAESPLQGARIESINGRAATEITAQLLKCLSGDTAILRSALLSLRFPFFYWKLVGANNSFRLKINGSETTLEGSSAIPEAYADPTFNQAFKFESLGDSAMLTLNTFVWGEKPKFFEFTKEAFAQMKKNGTKTLIVDIRANTGGDDDMWIEGVMPYIASTTFRNGSDYVLKIIEGRQREGQKVGDVVRASQTTVYPSAESNPLRFTGAVYVLIGPPTYSSSILFANVAKDYGFASIAGTGGAARVVQSGGTQNVKLPHTGIGVVVPRFILQPPFGKSGLLQPDILIPDNPFRPNAAIEILAQRSAKRVGTKDAVPK